MEPTSAAIASPENFIERNDPAVQMPSPHACRNVFQVALYHQPENFFTFAELGTLQQAAWIYCIIKSREA
jgi:hypothetical protein